MAAKRSGVSPASTAPERVSAHQEKTEPGPKKPVSFVHIVVHPQYRLSMDGETCKPVEVPLNWWLSKPVQLYLDDQITQNKDAIGEVVKVMQNSKDATPAGRAACPGMAPSKSVAGTHDLGGGLGPRRPHVRGGKAFTIGASTLAGSHSSSSHVCPSRTMTRSRDGTIATVWP